MNDKQRETAMPEKTELRMNEFGKKGWGMIIYIFFVYMFLSISLDMLNVSTIIWEQVMGWNQLALLSYAGFAGWIAVFVSIILGFWIKKRGIKIPASIGLIVTGIFLCLNGFATSIGMYAFTFLGHAAVSTSLVLIAPNVYSANWWPTRKGIALGWSTMGLPVEGLWSVPLFIPLFSLAHSMKVPYTVYGLMAVVLGFITLIFIKDYPEQAGAYPDNIPQTKEEIDEVYRKINEYKSPWTTKKLFSNPQVWLLILVFGTQFMCLMGTIMQFIPRFLAATDTAGNPLFQINELTSFFFPMTGIFGILGSYLFGWLDQKFGTKRATCFFTIYMVFIMALGILFWSNRIGSIALILLIGLMVGGLGNLFVSMIIQLFGRYDSSAANNCIIPPVVIIRTSVFFVISGVLGATSNNYLSLIWVLLGIAVFSCILSFFLSKDKLEIR
jgi:sugar phosphate permease